VPGLFTLDFVHSTAASRLQPHRFLTSAFLHGGIFHLLVNMDTLRRLPAWIETGLGTPLYVTAFLVSIVTGNLGHTLATYDVMEKAMCLGSSGGICGLYGLMYVSLLKMGNSRAATSIIKGLGLLLLYGFVFENISNAAHVGGFLGGALVGILCGPKYGKSYSLRRKWSVEVDASSRGYRQAMGFGTKPSMSGLVPLPVVWIAALVALGLQPRFRTIPKLILQGLLRPGSLYSLLN
jgi:membrane associated rhomboid family serine protease